MFSDELRRLADVRGLKTQQQIADACGLSQSFVARLLAGGRQKVTAETLYALSRGLGVSCEYWAQYFAGDAPAKKKKK